MAMRRCYLGPRARRAALAGRQLPAAPASHYVKDCHEMPVKVKVELDDVEVVPRQEPNAGGDTAVPRCSVANICVKEEDVVVKTENEMDEVTIKQELYIGPTVLQPKTVTNSLPPQALVSSHAASALPLRTDDVGSATPAPLSTVLAQAAPPSEIEYDYHRTAPGVPFDATLALHGNGVDHALKVLAKRLDDCSDEDWQSSDRASTECDSRAGESRASTDVRTGGKLYEFKHFKRNTTSTSNFIKHSNTTHSLLGGTPYECEQCEYSTSRLGNLKKHIQTHTGEKPYKCEQCEYRASQVSQLKRHMRTHLGDNPYKCEMCGYSTVLLDHLKTHIRSHTRKDPYKCKRCGYTTFELDAFKRHVYIHVEEKIYKCKRCEYSTGRQYNLETHERTHTGERPYKCEQCNYRASQRSQLKRHVFIHTHHKPYKCKWCDYSSSQLVHLKTHLYNHTQPKAM